MAQLPKELGSFDQVKQRAKKAFQRESLWHDLLEEAYEYFLPQRELFDNESVGSKKMDKIFDSTSLQAIQLGASKLQENVAPIWKRWAKFTLTEQAKRQLEQSDADPNEIQKKLDEQAEIVFDYINRSNFSDQFYEFALDLLIGTGTLQIDEDPNSDLSPIVFRAIPQKGVAFEESADGRIRTHYRTLKMRLRNVAATYRGFEFSDNLAKQLKDEPDSEVTLTQAVIHDQENNNFWGVVWEKSDTRPSWVVDFRDSSPMITGRYAKAANEIRGRGPAMQVLPDVKSLNKAKEFVLKKAAIDLSGVWTAVNDGITNPWTITISPGVVIPVETNSTQNPSLQRLDTTNDLRLAQFEIQELQNSIKLALFNDLRDPNGPVRSATEIAIEARELAKRIGSAYGRLQTEVLIPILNRVMWILKRRGLIEDIEIGGKAVTVKFTSPLAQAQNVEDLLAAQQAVEFTLQTAGPDQAKMAFKLEDFGTWAAKKTGMDSELIRSDAEKRKVIEAGAQAAQQGMINQGAQ